MTKLIRVFSVRDVPIFVHWSVFAICLFLLGAALRHILTAAAGLASYVGVLVVHELGHQWVALRRGYTVARIEIYPFHALCRLEQPEYPLDAAVISWGGVLAQFIFAIPFIVYINLFGYPGIGPLDAPFAIFGFLSPALAVFNLIPVAPLDGKLAWTYFAHRFGRPPKTTTDSGKTALQALEDAIRKAKQR